MTTPFSVKPQHLLVSLKSLQSICTKKLADKHLIDDEELTTFCRNVRDEIVNYQRAHNIPELEVVLSRFPEARSYKLRQAIIQLTSLVYRILGMLICILVVFWPFFGLFLLFFWTTGAAIGWIALYRRRERIRSDFQQIAAGCASAAMVIGNNESFK